MGILILTLLAALIAALLITGFLGIVIPRDHVFITVKFSWRIEPGTITFSWREQTLDVCQYPTSRFHRLWEALLIPRKICKVLLKAGEQKFENLNPGGYFFVLEQTGKHTVGFKKAEAIAKGVTTKGRSWAELPPSVGPFTMPDQFVSTENVKVHFTPAGASREEIEFQ